MARGGSSPMIKYTDAEVEQMLFAVVVCNGNIARALEQLEAAGTTVPRRTLFDLKARNPELYERLEEERPQRVKDAQARSLEFLAAGLSEAQAKGLANILSRTDDELSDLSPATIASMLANLAKAQASNIDKARLLRGEATTITEHRDIAGIIRTIRNRFPGVLDERWLDAMEGQAKELPSGGTDD